MHIPFGVAVILDCSFVGQLWWAAHVHPARQGFYLTAEAPPAAYRHCEGEAITITEGGKATVTHSSATRGHGHLTVKGRRTDLTASTWYFEDSTSHEVQITERAHVELTDCRIASCTHCAIIAWHKHTTVLGKRGLDGALPLQKSLCCIFARRTPAGGQGAACTQQ